MLKLKMHQEFPSIWPSDLVSDLIWPGFELDLDIIQTNILKIFQAAEAKNASSRVLTRFSFNLAK